MWRAHACEKTRTWCLSYAAESFYIGQNYWTLHLRSVDFSLYIKNLGLGMIDQWGIMLVVKPWGPQFRAPETMYKVMKWLCVHLCSGQGRHRDRSTIGVCWSPIQESNELQVYQRGHWTSMTGLCTCVHNIHACI